MLGTWWKRFVSREAFSLRNEYLAMWLDSCWKMPCRSGSGAENRWLMMFACSAFSAFSSAWLLVSSIAPRLPGYAS